MSASHPLPTLSNLPPSSSSTWMDVHSLSKQTCVFCEPTSGMVARWTDPPSLVFLPGNVHPRFHLFPFLTYPSIIKTRYSNQFVIHTHPQVTEQFWEKGNVPAFETFMPLCFPVYDYIPLVIRSSFAFFPRIYESNDYCMVSPNKGLRLLWSTGGVTDVILVRWPVE